MGVEGIAATTCFQIWRSALPEKWTFTGRNRRPPKDPINALLSLGYTIMGSEIGRAVNIKGLDPALGFLHTPQTGRESLVLDILELIRPEVDRFVIELINEKLTLRNFKTNQQDGCRLNKNGRKIFYPAWAAWLHSDESDGKSIKSLIIQRVNEVFNLFIQE